MAQLQWIPVQNNSTGSTQYNPEKIQADFWVQSPKEAVNLDGLNLSPQEYYSKQPLNLNSSVETNMTPTPQYKISKNSKGLDLYKDMIIKEANSAGIDPATLLAMAHIESNFDSNAQNTNYGGLFAINKKQHSNWADPVYNIREAIKLYKANENYAKKFGNTYDAGTAYLYHQQGLGGASSLLNNGNMNVIDALRLNKQWKDKSPEWVANKVVKANGGNPNMTAREFANLWINKANSLQKTYEKYLRG